MTKTEEFNRIMDRVNGEVRAKKEQKSKLITPILKRQNMNALQESLSKCTIKGNTVLLPEDFLPNYAEVRKALLAAGSVYKKNTFVFPHDPQPFIDRLMDGESVNIKKEFQAFFTPDGIADWMVQHLFIQPQQKVLEPSIGDGALVRAMRRKGYQNEVSAFEINPIYSKIAAAIPGVVMLGTDFMEVDTCWYGKFDRIIANPPFAKNQDIDHIYQMWNCLAPKGRLVTVASKHSQYANDKKSKLFREWLEQWEAESYDLESGAFKASGTMLASQILIIDRP